MLKDILRKYCTKLIYPTYSGDWYKRKGYVGKTDIERFDDFILKQKQPKSIYYHEFKNLKITREFIISGHCKIDSVMLKPGKSLRENKPGNGLYIICFQGKGEYYESRFRDMALLARETGATVIGFNPKGFQSSTGRTRILSDIADDGIAVIERLLDHKIAPTQIVLYGNSLGGAVQELVSEYFRKLKSIKFRQINSNSFRSLAAVFASNVRMVFLEKKLYCWMKYVGWEMVYSRNFYTTGPYRCYLTRKNDRTIKPSAAYCAKVNTPRDLLDCQEGYKEALQWLNDNSELVYLSSGQKDPHNLSLYNLNLRALDDNGKNLPVWYFINKYLEASNKYIREE